MPFAPTCLAIAIIQTAFDVRPPYIGIVESYGVEVSRLNRIPFNRALPFAGFTASNSDVSSPIKSVFLSMSQAAWVRSFNPYAAFDDYKGKPGSSMSAVWSKNWDKPHRTFTGYPLGLDLYSVGGPGSHRVMATCLAGQVEVTAHSRGRSIDRNIVWASDPDNTRGALAEDLARWALAQLTGDKLTGAGRTRLNGRDVDTFTGSGGRKHYDAHAWAVAHGRTQNLNRIAGRLSIETPRGTLLLILGSSKAKLGSEWITLPDVIAARDERFLIPEEVLRRVDP